MRELIELVLEEEVEAALGAGREQRVAERAGYRHGSKPRKLTLRTGTIPLEVPRARLVEADGGEREWQSRLVPRYRGASAEVEQSVLGVYLAGTNARRIRGALEPLLSGAALSLSLTSAGAAPHQRLPRHRSRGKSCRLEEKNFMTSRAKCATHFSGGFGTQPPPSSSRSEAAAR